MRLLFTKVRGMRVHLKIVTCCILLLLLLYLTYWTKCGDSSVPYTSVSLLSRFPYQTRTFPAKYGLTNFKELAKDELNYGEDLDDPSSDGLRTKKLNHGDFLNKIDCIINGDYAVPCQRDDRDIYVPFTFLKKYFEVYGKITSNNDGEERFEWQHSYSKYYVPKIKYDPKGAFMNFENFNVEARERVKCISAIDGVPVSTQWDIHGYLYPIQIAQFALSHFSKNLTESKLRTTVIEDGRLKQGRWYSTDGKFARKWDAERNSDVFHFQTQNSIENGGISIDLKNMQDYTISFDLKLSTNGSFTIIVEDRDKHERYFIHYVCNDMYIFVSGSNIYYGMGLDTAVNSKWKRITRDVTVDVRKGLLSKAARKSKIRLQLVSLTLRGEGILDNLTISSSAHMAHFFDATEWMVKSQDKQGGWPIPVERKFNSLGMGNLNPGWYSAMAQGQAISALTRAFYITGDQRYLDTALSAIKLFKVNSEDKGVLAHFLDKYVWYEEYPTVPGSFVLNGFIYSLIGLYDLKTVCGGKCEEVGEIFEAGMKSLKSLLPFYDSGMGSFYDLRHFTFGIAPNLARWDYHTTHIGQLLLLATIDDAEIIRSTAKRWIEYMKGKRASHN